MVFDRDLCTTIKQQIDKLVPQKDEKFQQDNQEMKDEMLKIKSTCSKTTFGTDFVSFVEESLNGNVDDNDDNNIYVVDSSRSQPLKFTQLLCTLDNDKHADNKFNMEYKSISDEQASLVAIGLNHDKNILTFKLTDSKYGECIVVIDSKKYYNVFSTNEKKWIVRRSKAIKLETNDSRAVIASAPMRQS